jgi:glycosyltransferase involved in cell wall biosynthesis
LHEQLGLATGFRSNAKPLHSRAIDFFKSIISYPDPMKGWIPFALKAICQEGRKEKFDAIVSTAHPVSCHVIAHRAKAMLKSPWVADFRDLWTQNAYYAHGRIRRTFEERLEKKTLEGADALVTISEPLAELLRGRYCPKPVHCITNGYDPEEFPARPAELTKTFTITYAGQLYRGKRDPSLLFEVVGELVREGVLARADLRLRFYGPAEDWLSALVEHFGLKEVVEICGVVPRITALDRLRESQLLLLLRWSDPREEGIYTGKVFEYLALRRPILALGGPPGVVLELLAETNAGIHVTSRAGLRQFLVEAYDQFRRSGRVSYAGKESGINQYTHREMARKFAEVLNKVAEVSTL